MWCKRCGYTIRQKAVEKAASELLKASEELLHSIKVDKDYEVPDTVKNIIQAVKKAKGNLPDWVSK